MPRIRRALLSVSNKEGLVELARGLAEQGVALVSSGGTAKLLREAGLDVTAVADYTGAPEILDGRVKTLHPRIFGGILARPTQAHRAQLAEQQIDEIDLVVVNLYPFRQTIGRPDVSVEQAIEQIDIGGPSLLRAAAKNHERVAVVVDPADYAAVLSEIERGDGRLELKTRQRLAVAAFAHTAAYDNAIAEYLQRQFPDSPAELDFPDRVELALVKSQSLRYGENPHQRGAFYIGQGGAWGGPVPQFDQLGGKELSFNNLVDVDAAWALARDLPSTAVCVIKHTNPCGAAWIAEGAPDEVFRRAKETDPVSAFGGIVACNTTITAALAAELKEMFLEAVVAAAFDDDALQLLRRKKKLRLLRHRGQPASQVQIRSAAGGILVQEADRSVEGLDQARVVSKRPPTAEELADLDFAWRVCKHVKSNAIVFAKGGQLVGVGAGQMSRVDSVQLAAHKARLPLGGTVVASDAFFPFRDGVDEAAKAGATAVVQPGGSVRDEEAIGAADEHGLAMVFTGVRHFKH